MPALTTEEISRVIEMAWEDRTPFEAIHQQYGLSEAMVIALMRKSMQSSSFRMWRKRMAGRVTKHQALRSDAVSRHKANHRVKQF